MKFTSVIFVGVALTTMLAVGCSKTAPPTPAAFNDTLAESSVTTEPAAPLPAEPTSAEQPLAPVAVETVPVKTAANPAPLPTDANSLVKPLVILSDAHQKTCLLNVGDKFPDVTVTDIEGTNHQVRRLLGDHLTVIVFWSEESTMGMEQFRRIPIDVLADFGSRGVNVVAAHVGGDVARVRNLTGNAAGKIISLVDKDGQFFSQVATTSVPRTYIVDADGKILWFDIEYSQSTQRSLRDALAYYVSHG